MNIRIVVDKDEQKSNQGSGIGYQGFDADCGLGVAADGVGEGLGLSSTEGLVLGEADGVIVGIGGGMKGSILRALIISVLVTSTSE